MHSRVYAHLFFTTFSSALIRRAAGEAGPPGMLRARLCAGPGDRSGEVDMSGAGRASNVYTLLRLVWKRGETPGVLRARLCAGPGDSSPGRPGESKGALRDVGLRPNDMFFFLACPSERVS
jgi:hypothetical protein